jgi:glycosyltransferase involved in cell wall biosynthesis
MNIIFVHNYYQQPGGEDSVYAAEASLIESRGHRVERYTVHNDLIRRKNPIVVAGATLWNMSTYRELRSIYRRAKPQVVHFHNTFPLVSPAAYYAAKAEGVSVVQTLHNYRLLCPNALFFRGGSVCEDCLGRFVPWPGVVHRCYRGSFAASSAVVSMLTVHRALGTWSHMVDVYIALTEFAKRKFIEAGLPAEKIVVKPNFVYPDPGVGEGKGGYALFVGRLSTEKGLDTLLAAWERVGEKLPLRIVGDGPLTGKVSEAARRLKGVEWLGRRPREEVLALMKDASFLIFPSVCYEGFPMTIAEAYAVGLPVLASNLGGMSSLVDSGRTGFHFRPGDPEDLVAKVEWALSHPEELAAMRKESRAEYEAKYTAERNYQMLMDIYEKALKIAEKRKKIHLPQ